MVRTISELSFRRSVTETVPNEVTVQEPDLSNPNTNYSWTAYRRVITLATSSLTKDIANFPLTLFIPWTSNMQRDGSDIHFSISPTDASILPHEMVGYADYNLFVFTVKVPLLYAGKDTTLYMFYGASYTASTGSVWGDNAELVLHMDEGDTTAVDTTEYVTIYDGAKTELIVEDEVTELILEFDPAIDASTIPMSGSLLIELAAMVRKYDPDTGELSDPYVTDDGSFELTSAGTYDNQELHYDNPITNLGVDEDLTEYEIPLNSLGTAGSPIDLSNINYFRWYETNDPGAGFSKWIGVGRIRLKGPEITVNCHILNDSSSNAHALRRDASRYPQHTTIGQFLSSQSFEGTPHDHYFTSTARVDIGNKDFTLSCWVNVAVGFGPVVLWSFPDFAVFINASGTLSVWWNDDEVRGEVGSGLVDNTFHHIVVRRSHRENSIDVWIDGTKYNIGVAGSDIKPTSSDRLYIGSNGEAGTAKFFRGYLAEMLYLQQAMSEEWIELLYDAQSDGVASIGSELSYSVTDSPNGVSKDLGALGTLYISR